MVSSVLTATSKDPRWTYSWLLLEHEREREREREKKEVGLPQLGGTRGVWQLGFLEYGVLSSQKAAARKGFIPLGPHA